MFTESEQIPMFPESAPQSAPAPRPARVVKTSDRQKAREEKGRLIAASGRIVRAGDLYVVPSQTDSKTYAVNLEAEEAPTCSCPDYELNGAKCKHLHAVEWFIIQQSITVEEMRGATVETTLTKAVRVTYKQAWPAYNAAQTTEQDHVESLLRDLCGGIVDPAPVSAKGGRPRFPLGDAIFGCVQKVYSGMSGRRAQSDLRASEKRGNVDKRASYNLIFKTMESPAITPILRSMVTESGKPLAAVERDFAIDSTGFGTCTFQRWYDVKHGREAKKQRYLKLHISSGVKTNVVAAAVVTDADANDSPEFKPLASETAQTFTIDEMSGDKAYLSIANLEAIEALGAKVFVPFKFNSQPDGNGETWHRLYHYFAMNRAEFLACYHKRSNVESTMWMLKSKFGPSLRSKSETAQVNELYCKVICHNLACLVSAFHELKIDPKFYQRAGA